MPQRSPTTLDFSTTTDSPSQFVSTYEPHAGCEKNAVRIQEPSTESIFDEFDIFANFTKEAHDASGTNFDWYSVVSPIRETIPTQEPTRLPTPIDFCAPSMDINAGQQNSTRPSPSHSSQGDDEEVPLQDMALLHRNYFQVFYTVMPILDMKRFSTELAKDSNSPPIRSLNYAVALIGTTISSKYARLQQPCYNMARKYMELCERDEDHTNLSSLNLFQALLFIIRYEITAKRFTRAWMTLGRAIRLAKMLNLHQMDRGVDSSDGGTGASSDLQMCLPPTQDPTSLEERRRSFWALYIFEGYASTRSKMPCQFHEAQIYVALPSPGDLSPEFIPSPMPLLNSLSTRSASSSLSSYTGIVLISALGRLCYSHVWVLAPDPSPQTNTSHNDTNPGFWDRHYALVKAINDRTALLQRHLTPQAIQADPLAFGLHINFCAVDIFLHEAAVDEVQKQQLPQLVAVESCKRSAAAACKIANAVRINWPVQRSEHDIFTLQATFIAWPLVMGLSALSRNLHDCAEDATANGVADYLRLLLGALDQVEEEGGYWHRCVGGSVGVLREWDGRGMSRRIE